MRLRQDLPLNEYLHPTEGCCKIMYMVSSIHVILSICFLAGEITTRCSSHAATSMNQISLKRTLHPDYPADRVMNTLVEMLTLGVCPEPDTVEYLLDNSKKACLRCLSSLPLTASSTLNSSLPMSSMLATIQLHSSFTLFRLYYNVWLTKPAGQHDQVANITFTV